MEKVASVGASTVSWGVLVLDLQENQEKKKISNSEESLVPHENETLKWSEKSQKQLTGI